jgi:hypothetical protein
MKSVQDQGSVGDLKKGGRQFSCLFSCYLHMQDVTNLNYRKVLNPKTGAEIYLIGTNHLSAKSSTEVRQVHNPKIISKCNDVFTGSMFFLLNIFFILNRDRSSNL